jgi:hypothetical protein
VRASKLLFFFSVEIIDWDWLFETCQKSADYINNNNNNNNNKQYQFECIMSTKQADKVEQDSVSTSIGERRTIVHQLQQTLRREALLARLRGEMSADDANANAGAAAAAELARGTGVVLPASLTVDFATRVRASLGTLSDNDDADDNDRNDNNDKISAVVDGRRAARAVQPPIDVPLDNTVLEEALARVATLWPTLSDDARDDAAASERARLIGQLPSSLAASPLLAPLLRGESCTLDDLPPTSDIDQW